jgi:hypothetical protein
MQTMTAKVKNPNLQGASGRYSKHTGFCYILNNDSPTIIVAWLTLRALFASELGIQVTLALTYAFPRPAGLAFPGGDASNQIRLRALRRSALSPVRPRSGRNPFKIKA